MTYEVRASRHNISVDLRRGSCLKHASMLVISTMSLRQNEDEKKKPSPNFSRTPEQHRLWYHHNIRPLMQAQAYPPVNLEAVETQMIQNLLRARRLRAIQQQLQHQQAIVNSLPRPVLSPVSTRSLFSPCNPPILLSPRSLPIVTNAAPLTANVNEQHQRGLDVLRSAAKLKDATMVERIIQKNIPEVAKGKEAAVKGANEDEAITDDESAHARAVLKDKVYVDVISEFDVLCGRGGRSNHHAGNKKYRQVISDMKRMYQSTETKTVKTDLSRAIVEHVCGYGGRFIKKDPESGRYFILTKAEARKKTSQALRETKELKWIV